MKKYPKINSVYKRDDKGKIILGDWATPEIECLRNAGWYFTEKIDGTNIRIHFDGERVEFSGRTDEAQIPKMLFDYLCTTFTKEKMLPCFPDASITPVTLYGEGCGHKIQSGGERYFPNTQELVLFDVLIGDFWLKMESVVEIANALRVRCVATLGEGTLDDAIRLVRTGLFSSDFGCFEPEGVVARPKAQMFDRMGNRIMVKIKKRDLR